MQSLPQRDIDFRASTTPSLQSNKQNLINKAIACQGTYSTRSQRCGAQPLRITHKYQTTQNDHNTPKPLRSHKQTNYTRPSPSQGRHRTVGVSYGSIIVALDVRAPESRALINNNSLSSCDTCYLVRHTGSIHTMIELLELSYLLNLLVHRGLHDAMLRGMYISVFCTCSKSIQQVDTRQTNNGDQSFSCSLAREPQKHA